MAEPVDAIRCDQLRFAGHFGESLTSDRSSIPWKGRTSDAFFPSMGSGWADVIVRPVVGFDGCYRPGAGYYDRTLARLHNKPLTIASGFETQRLRSIEPPHDIAMKLIVTDEKVPELRWCRGKLRIGPERDGPRPRQAVADVPELVRHHHSSRDVLQHNAEEDVWRGVLRGHFMGLQNAYFPPVRKSLKKRPCVQTFLLPLIRVGEFLIPSLRHYACPAVTGRVLFDLKAHLVISSHPIDFLARHGKAVRYAALVREINGHDIGLIAFAAGQVAETGLLKDVRALQLTKLPQGECHRNVLPLLGRRIECWQFDVFPHGTL